MASQGPNNPASGTNDAAVGTVAWNNPGNITTSGNNYATADVGFPMVATTNYLLGSQFGFSIPSGANIEGIQMEIEMKAEDDAFFGDVRDSGVYLIKSGSPVGDNKARPGTTHWPTTDTYISYGGPSDLWGTTWSVSEINDNGFGGVISAGIFPQDAYPIPSVDHMRITIYYSETQTGFNIALV